MKISTITPINSITGTPLKDEFNKDILIRTILLRCLDVGNNEQLKLSASIEQRVRAFDLSLEINKNNDVELTPEDIVYIKDRLDKLFGSNVSVYVQLLRALEEKNEN